MLLKLSIIFAALAALVYFLRRNFRRAFYVLWTGDENPDWDKIYEKWYGKAGKETLARDRGERK